MTVEEKPVISEISYSDAVAKLPVTPATHMFVFEPQLFTLAQQFSKDYSGGLWEGREGVDVVYFVPDAPNTDDGKFHVAVSTNFYEGRMSPDAYGIGLTMVALNRVMWHQPTDPATMDRLHTLYYALRDFAAEHEEASQILGFID